MSSVMSRNKMSFQLIKQDLLSCLQPEGEINPKQCILWLSIVYILQVLKRIPWSAAVLFTTQAFFSNFVSAHVYPALHYCHICSAILRGCPDPLHLELTLEKIKPQKNIKSSSVNEKLQYDVISTDARKYSSMYYFPYSLNSFVFKQLLHNILINGFAILFIFFQAPLFL